MSKKVLLIADDDEMSRTIIKRFLKNSFDVLEAEDGYQTLDIIMEQHVDVLLLDIIMPKRNGLEVLDDLRKDERYNDLGILVATSTKEKTEREALSLGADDIVSKPYDPVVIQKRMENIMLMKEAKRQKELLLSDNVQALISQEETRIESVVETHLGKFHKYAEIILQNLENGKLVAQMAEDIHREADRLKEELSR